MRKLRLTVLLVLILSLAVFSFADWKITQKSVTQIGDQPAKESETVTYIAKHGIYSKVNDKFGILYNAEKDEIYLLLTENKQYMVPNWKQIETQRKALSDFMKSVTINFKNTGIKEKVLNYNTEVWEMTISGSFGNTSVKFWVTKDLKMPENFEKGFLKIAKMNPRNTDKIIKMTKKMEGYPLKTLVSSESPQGKIIVDSVVKKVEEKKLKKAGFELYKKYNKIDYDQQKLQQVQQ